MFFPALRLRSTFNLVHNFINDKHLYRTVVVLFIIIKIKVTELFNSGLASISTFGSLDWLLLLHQVNIMQFYGCNINVDVVVMYIGSILAQQAL